MSRSARQARARRNSLPNNQEANAQRAPTAAAQTLSDARLRLEMARKSLARGDRALAGWDAIRGLEILGDAPTAEGSATRGELRRIARIAGVRFGAPQSA